MIMMIHGLVTDTDQTVYEEDLIDEANLNRMTRDKSSKFSP